MLIRRVVLIHLVDPGEDIAIAATFVGDVASLSPYRLTYLGMDATGIQLAARSEADPSRLMAAYRRTFDSPEFSSIPESLRIAAALFLVVRRETEAARPVSLRLPLPPTTMAFGGGGRFIMTIRSAGSALLVSKSP